MIAVEFEPGDVAARESVTCSHGRTGYCWDDATPEERAAVDFLHQHAFDYAMAHLPDRDTFQAETFAAWSVAQAWHPGVVVVGGSQATDLAKWLATA